MKGIKIANIANLIAIIVLQIIPFGVRVSSESEIGIASDILCSYFDSVPLKSGNFGPFVSAILTIIALSVFLVSFFVERNRPLLLSSCILPAIALLGSLMPLLFNSYTLLGGIISALLLLSTEASIYIYSRAFEKK